MAIAENGNYLYIFVAAIDIGSKYSMYAFSSKHDFQFDPLKISFYEWNAGSRSLLTHKTPTALLLNPDKSFNSFGYDAVNKFADLALDDEHHDYFFFRNYRKVLFNNETLNRNTLISDEGGDKTVTALEIFSHSIRFLKDHLMTSLQRKLTDIGDRDFKYVLTVPAIWDNKATQLMREAAKMGGIMEALLYVVVEPEAASIYCQHLLVERGEHDSFLEVMKSVTKYMVLDLGDRATDITIFQQQPDKTQRVLLTSSRAFGGNSVDDAFRTFLAEIVGERNMKEFEREDMDGFIVLFSAFETRKNTISEDKPNKVTISMPISLMDIVRKDKEKKSLAEAVLSSPFGEEVTWAKKKLQIANNQFQKLFTPTIDEIIRFVEESLGKKEFRDINCMFVVGGFAECQLVQSAIRQRFGRMAVYIPDDAVLTVLKGAVLYGHIGGPAASVSVFRYTYGCQHWPTFNGNLHPLDKLMVINGEMRCKDIFYTLQEKGRHIELRCEKSHVVQALSPQDELRITVYVSSKESPKFIDEEGCFPLGTVTVLLPKSSRGVITLKETLVFQEEGLVFKVKELNSGETFESEFLFRDGVM